MLKNFVKAADNYLKYAKRLLEKREFGRILILTVLEIVLKLNWLLNETYYRMYYVINLISNNKAPTLKINDVLMKIDLKDNGLSKDLIIYKKREFFSTEFMKNFIEDGDYILEVGANKGYYALLEGKINKKGIIYAIEPIKENYSMLKESIELNGFSNISLFPDLALSDKTAEKEMYFYGKQNWCSFTQNQTENILERRKISAVTMDEFVKRENFYPTFLRMDIEGHEYEVIKGCIDTLKKTKNLKIFVEMHPPLMSKQKIKFIIDVLRDNNFKIISVFQEPPTSDLYRFKKIINYINEGCGIPKYGKIEILNYNDLEDCLINYGRFSNPYLECFFEKKNIN